ncbi:C1 family peptidase [Desulfobacterales bacterium HSG2]|nr:C1 family peptidase [Desulfobacterales bacterium HSG2]
MIAKKIVGLIGVLAMVCVAAGTAYSSGYLVDDDLWIRAVINTVEKGPIDAMWERGGEDRTAGGDRVIWGHFYASPDDVIWGSRQNPDLFVKIWFDRGGRVDVNFFHVSVPDIDVYSSYRYQGAEDQQGRTTMERRYIRQYYENGESHTDESYEDGKPPAGYSPAGDPSGYALTTNLRIAALINTVEKGAVRALWREGGTDTTADGHKVIWGHFYANPEDVSWGSGNNPDLFVKIWFDSSGRVDVNFFHVSVPDIEVYSDLPVAGEYDSRGTTIIGNRYIRHEYHDKWWQSVSLSLLGDLGRPHDYAQTMKSFSESMPDYDAYVDQLLNAFDWRDKGMVTPAKHQGGCGSCWAFASVGALESKILIAGGPRYDLSEQQLLSCAGYDCDGGNSYALMFWYDEGPMQEGCTEYAEVETDCINLEPCPILSYNTEGYYTVKTETTNEIKTSLYKDGPAYFRFDAYSDFFTFWDSGSPGEVYTQTGGSWVGGHAGLIIGWDDNKKAWLCKNSWGENEGPSDDGTFWIAYSGHANDLYFGMANFKIKGHEEPEQRNPVANAGNDRTVDEGDTVTLDGSGSYDPDGSIASYLWEQIAGSSVTFSNSASARPIFTAPNVGSQGESLSFRLTVIDNDGAQDTDTCVVSISKNPLIVNVISPSNDSEYYYSDEISFSGYRNDDEDLIWRSNIDGNIGVGTLFEKSDLSVGVHLITLSAIDSNGNAKSDAITLTVKDTSHGVIRHDTCTYFDYETGYGYYPYSSEANRKVILDICECDYSCDIIIGDSLAFNLSILTEGVYWTNELIRVGLYSTFDEAYEASYPYYSIKGPYLYYNSEGAYGTANTLSSSSCTVQPSKKVVKIFSGNSDAFLLTEDDMNRAAGTCKSWVDLPPMVYDVNEVSVGSSVDILIEVQHDRTTGICESCDSCREEFSIGTF